MKIDTRNLIAAIAASLVFSCANAGFAQTSVTTTTTSDGTISEFTPDTIVIRSQTQPEPIRYSFTKTTIYVDEAGAPVSIETVKSGLPVTVHYIKQGDRMIANRVIVHRTTATTAPVSVEEKKTTTTTTITK
jgi:hypothetical protein